MLRLRLINPYLLIVSVLCCALSPAAMAVPQELLKIDINTSLNITYVGWTGWYPGGNTTVRQTTFSNGIGVAFFNPTTSAVQVGVRGNTNWGAFAGDSMELVDPPAGQGDLACTISYLSPGNYTFTTYHNEWIADSNMNVYQRINADPNTLVYPSKAQVHHIPNNDYVIANGAVPLTFTITQPGQTFTSQYITSFNFNNPDPNFADANQYNVAICGFKLVANNIYAAYSPSPLPESRIRYNTTYSLSWAAPDPLNPPATLLYDVYFTTNAADLTYGTPATPQYPADKRLATNTAALTLPCPSLTAYTNYYWRVDTWEGATRTTGMVWHFDTNNQPPTLDVGPAQVTKQGRMVTLSATATDLDGLPIGGGPITYKWTHQYSVGSSGDPNFDPNYNDVWNWPLPATTQVVSFVMDPNDAHTGNGRTWVFRCEASDSADSATKDVAVTVYDNSLTNCEVNKKLGNYEFAIRSAGDFNDDCITDLKDLGTYVMQWLACKAINNVCP